MRADVAIAYRP